MGTLLVMTGVTTQQELEELSAQPGFKRPDYVMNSFADMLTVQELLQRPAAG